MKYTAITAPTDPTTLAWWHYDMAINDNFLANGELNCPDCEQKEILEAFWHDIHTPRVRGRLLIDMTTELRNRRFNTTVNNDGCGLVINTRYFDLNVHVSSAGMRAEIECDSKRVWFVSFKFTQNELQKAAEYLNMQRNLPATLGKSRAVDSGTPDYKAYLQALVSVGLAKLDVLNEQVEAEAKAGAMA